MIKGKTELYLVGVAAVVMGVIVAMARNVDNVLALVVTA
jgi:hypothetical protein